MRNVLSTAILLIAATLPSLAQEGAKPEPAPKPASAQYSAPDIKMLAVITGYLERMELSFKTIDSEKYPIVAFSVKMENATHKVHALIDMKTGLVYIFLNRFLSLPDDHPRRDEVLRELMKRNWELNIGKFEWDPGDGEVRFSYCFTTENGVGFEAFQAIVATVLKTGDRVRPGLVKMLDAGS